MRRPLRAARVGLWTVLVVVAAGQGCSQRPAPAPPWLAFQPQSAAFELPYGGELSEDFRLTGPAPANVTLAVEGAADPDLRIEPLPPALGPGLRIHARGRRVGVRVGTLQVVARPGPAKPIPLLYALRVSGTLTVVPTNPLVDLRAADPAAVIAVHSTQPDFTVTAVAIVSGPFAATLARDSEGRGYQVRVTAQTLPSGARGATGTLVIHSNDRVEPRKEVPLFAFGRDVSASAHVDIPSAAPHARPSVPASL